MTVLYYCILIVEWLADRALMGHMIPFASIIGYDKSCKRGNCSSC